LPDIAFKAEIVYTFWGLNYIILGFREIRKQVLTWTHNWSSFSLNLPPSA